MTMFCDCGNPEAHRGEHIPKPMTDTPLDLDAILAAHASASPYGRTEVAGRFHASYYADDADVALVFASIPALIAALRKAEAEVERLRPEVASYTAPICACGHYRSSHTPLDFGDCAECPNGTCGKYPGMKWDIWHRDTTLRAMRAEGQIADLRERIAQAIDQAWAEANDQRPRSEYRDGYLDGLEHAEAAARSTPLTMGGAS